MTHAPYCIIHHHNGVIDQHTHSNDESCERRAINALTQAVHAEHRAANGEDEREAYERPRTKAHREHNHHHYDSHRLEQIEHKREVGTACYLILGIERYDIHTDRHLTLKASKQRFDLSAQPHHIGIAIRGNTYTYGTATINLHYDRRRIDISLLDTGNIAQTKLPSIGSNEQLIGNIIDGRVYTRLKHAYAHLRGIDLARINDVVLLREDGRNHLGRYREISQC